MIVEFSFGNYKSFKDIQTLHLQAAKIKSKFLSIDKSNIFEGNDRFTLLKSKVIYGANASGKSNVIKAFSAMLHIIQRSFKDDKAIKNKIEPFRLSEETVNEPTFFQLSFMLDEVLYRYGMQLKDGKVTDEWLFGTPGKKEVYFFIREGLSVKINNNQFKEGLKIVPNNDDEIPIYGENALFLTVAAASKRPLAEKIVHHLFENITIFSGLTDTRMMDFAINSLENVQFKSKLITLLNSVGMDIHSIDRIEIDLEKLPKEIRDNISTEKKLTMVEITKKMTANDGTTKYVQFDLSEHEAEGTKKIISFAPFIFSALAEGKTIIIDEFDARLHPRLSWKIIELFNSNITNPKNAQLIIVSHDTNLMDAKLFRRDQISFVEKDKQGASKLYSLVKYKGIRNNSSFEKDYLKGKYGAVPFLNQVDNLFATETILNNG
jgi:AAA15 family ATPase/GTPase